MTGSGLGLGLKDKISSTSSFVAVDGSAAPREWVYALVTASCLMERSADLRMGGYMRDLSMSEVEDKYASISASSSSEATGVRGLPGPASDEQGSEENVENDGVAGGELGGGNEGGRSSRSAVLCDCKQVTQSGWGVTSCLRVCLTGGRL